MFNNAAIYLISTLFDLYIAVLMIRVILTVVFANYFDPLTQLITKVTNPVIKPIRKFLPNIGRVETASVVFILLLEIIKFSILIFLTFGVPNILGVLILSIGDGLKLFLQIFFYAIIVQAILSFIQPYSPMNRILQSITQPVLRPFQRFIPLVSGVDLSPIPALITLQMLMLLLTAPIISLGMGMAVA